MKEYERRRRGRSRMSMHAIKKRKVDNTEAMVS
jgi:hypothetical protein